MKAAVLVSAVGLVALMPASQVWAEPVVRPKVTTDTSVDCSSLETIVRDVTRPGMSDREKTLALYHWFRRVIFHFRLMGSDRRDVLRVVNSYGCDLCGSQAAVFRLILNAAGVKARVTSGDGGPELGHTVVEAWWNDKWHVLDTMTSFYCLTRDDPPDLASMADIAKDPTLATKAVEEGRAGPEFLYCLKQTEVDQEQRTRMQNDGMKADIAWTLLVIRPDKETGAPRNILTFWEQGPKKARPLAPDNAYSGTYVPGLLDITLKPHEEYVRLWDNVGKWVKQGTFDNVGPYHTCGGVDEHDPINFKYYEPYKKMNVGYAKYAYRYYGNGWLDWQPKGGEVLLGASAANLALDQTSGVLKVADPKQAATLTIPVKSPYAVVETALALEVVKADPGATISVAYIRNRQILEKAVPAQAGRQGVVFEDTLAGVIDYELKVTVTGGAAEFAVRQVKTTFMLNMYALPSLAPGENKITVDAETKALTDAKLLVTYEWDEGEDWRDARTLTREVTTFPTTFTVNVKGPKMPRMKRLVMKAVPN